MRWEIKQGRVKRVFLLFPKTLTNFRTSKKETRWLEFANVSEVYIGPGLYIGEWDEVYFVDDEKGIRFLNSDSGYL